MNMLDFLLRKKPRTPAVIETEIAVYRTGIADSRTRIQRAQADREAAIETLDDDRHKAADEAIVAAGRAIERGERALSVLIPAHTASVKAEERAALKARAEAARKRVGEAPKLFDRYEELATEIARVAAGLNAIDLEVDGVNTAIKVARKADPDAELPPMVDSVTVCYRTEPAVVMPEQRIMEEEWEEVDPKTDQYRPATIFNASGRPQNLASRLVKRQRIIPGKTKPGRVLPSPTYGLSLPPARLDQKPFWPAG